MHLDRSILDVRSLELEIESPNRPAALHQRPERTAAAVDQGADKDWLQKLSHLPDTPLEKKLVAAIGWVADELEAAPGPVEMIVTPACWHGFAEVIVFRHFVDGTRASLRVLSLDGFEQLVCSWSRRAAEPFPPRPRRRSRGPVRLVFDRTEVGAPASPSRWDLMLYVAHRVREHLAAIERV